MTRVETPQGIYHYRRGHVDRGRFADEGAEKGSMGSDGTVGGGDAMPEVEESIRELVGSGGDAVPYDQFIAAVNAAYTTGYREGRETALGVR